MSIRLRLTVWYIFLLATVLIAYSGGLYAILSFNMLNEVDRTLETRAAEVQNGATAALELQSDPLITVLRGQLTLPGANTFATPGIYVQVSTLTGTPASRSENLAGQALTIPSPILDRVVKGESLFTNQVIGRIPLRMYAAPLMVRGHVIGIIQVAQSYQGVTDTLRQLATLLGSGILGALLIAAVLGALLARSALAPIERIRATAESISRSGDLTRRIEPTQTRDETAHLAGTFNEMLSRIEELFRVQQRFVADVSHELRSPLTAIQGNLDLLRRGAAESADERHVALSAIEGESGRMQRLISDLLLMAQADAGVHLQKQRVELDTILLEVYRQAHLTATNVRVSLGTEDQAQVMGDPDRLKQLFLNLVDNAIKYTPAGGEVVLSFQCQGSWVWVQVSDTGIGIPAEDLPRIFDRFYRVDKARSREQGGTGLGLSIVKWIVDAHGGQIDVESEVGKGTRFTVRLPVAP